MEVEMATVVQSSASNAGQGQWTTDPKVSAPRTLDQQKLKKKKKLKGVVNTMKYLYPSFCSDFFWSRS